MSQELVQAVTLLEMVEEVSDGTRVPTNTGVPCIISGSLWTISLCPCCGQPIVM
jgi:hypothetical protein